MAKKALQIPTTFLASLEPSSSIASVLIFLSFLSLNSTLFPPSTSRSFITIKDQKFVDENCNDYVVAG